MESGGVDGIEGGFDPESRVRADGLQAEAVFAGWNQRQRDGRVARAPVKVLRHQPRAQAWIANLRLALPEIGLEAKLNEQMIEVQLDDIRTAGKIAAHISRAHVDAGQLAAFAMRFDDHRILSSDGERGPPGMSPV